MQANRHRIRRGGIALALLAAVVLALSGASTSSAKPVAGGPPDTYVANWDAVGTQAFSAAALSPAEGHTIFAYVAIAVYDSVMAIKGGHEPFAVDVDAPANTSAEAAVAAAARRVLENYLPAQTGIVETAYAASLSGIPDGVAKTNGVTVGTAVADLLIVQRSDDGFRANVGYTPPNPAGPGRLGPDGGNAADRLVSRSHAAIRAPFGRPVPAQGSAGSRQQEVGGRVQRGQDHRLERGHVTSDR